MKRMFVNWNWRQNGRFRYEWSIVPFLDGTICRKTDLRRVSVFGDAATTKQEWLRRALLPDQRHPHEELERMQEEFAEREARDELTACEVTLYEGRIKAQILMEPPCQKCASHEGILILEGDEALFDEILPYFARGEDEETGENVDEQPSRIA